MSDKSSPGYDFFAPAPPATPPQVLRPAPPAAPAAFSPAPSGPTTGQPIRLNPATFVQAQPFQLPRWANLVFSLVTVALIGSLITAAAIPMVRRHQQSSQWKNTTIALPSSFGGRPRQVVDQPATVAELTGDRFVSPQLALYGRNPLSLLLIIAAKPKQVMSDKDQRLARAQFAKGFAATSSGARLTLTQAKDAGTLGGWFGCGKVTGVTVCIATDPGSMVAVVMGPSTKQPQTVAMRARQSAVTRS